jgi:hypothetical protein
VTASGPGGALVITTGVLYRLIPNWSTVWDFKRRKPKEKAFRRDTADGAMSMLLASRITPERIVEKKPGFGICRFQVEEVTAPPPLNPQVFQSSPKRRPPEPKVWVEEDRDPFWGDAHFVVKGLTKSLEEWLYELGKDPKRMERWPDEEVNPIPPDRDDRPRV